MDLQIVTGTADRRGQREFVPGDPPRVTNIELDLRLGFPGRLRVKRQGVRECADDIAVTQRAGLPGLQSLMVDPGRRRTPQVFYMKNSIPDEDTRVLPADGLGGQHEVVCGISTDQ